MRFHIGFSKRISLKWLLLIIGGLLAFFGIDKAFAASMSADATATYVLSPYGAKEYCTSDGCVNYTSGSLINNTSGTPYNVTWESQRYSAFKTITSPHTALGYRDDIFGARLRWTYSTSSMAKCSNGQAITYTFKFFLRNIQSGTLPQLWDTADLYEKFWIRSSQTNYDCSIQEKDSHVITVNCTIPNPTASVYVYIEDFTIPHLSIIDDGYYNVGLAPIQYSCGGLDSASIIQNNNSNTNNIINNNNQNTQEITTAIDNNIQATTDLTDTLVDDTLPEIPDFSLTDLNISSTTERLFLLPINLLNYIVSGYHSDSCRALRIDLSSLTLLSGTGNTGNYVLEVPCLGLKVKQLLGNWYDIFDHILGAIVFYYFVINVVLRIQMTLSGVDTLPSFYTSHGRTKSLLVDNKTGEVIGNG